MDISHDEYVQTPVPYERRGNGWSVFLIILGTQCGLPGIILSGEIFRSMGIGMGCLAIVAGTLLTGVLSSGTSYLGAKSGLSFAVITESVFGRRASMLVKLAIGLALVGWFASTCGLLGQSASAILRAHYGLDISPLAISAPISVLIVASVLFGAEGLERIGTIAAPAVGLAIAGVIWMVWRGGSPHHAEAAASAGIWHGSAEFGRFVSAVVGSYVVGILIQPDYSRYVRRPTDAMAGTFGALSIAWPLVMIGGGVPAAISGHATLIEALPDAGLTLLAVLISVLCAWVDAAACLYSGSLALANLGGSRRLNRWVVGAGGAGVVLNILGMNGAFMSFLLALGIILPPIAPVILLDVVMPPLPGMRSRTVIHLLAWGGGVLAGIASLAGVGALTGVPSLDALIAAAFVSVAARLVLQIQDMGAIGRRRQV
ncbi:cytosine permease [Gluconacetobacter sp. Hr-1-5]|uniref:cytosine permease n=1 Tax=Gluconacetobacter sp. Hr-1-5 TaxID=3395370 RepID=UPI003B5168E0